MKKLKFLFLAPAVFAMVACGGIGKEVTVEKAKELAKGMKDVEQPKDYEAVIEMKTYDAEDKSNTVAKYTLKKNANDEFYAAINGENTGGEGESAYNYKTDVEVYYVNNDTYDNVLYMKNNDEEDKEDQITVVVKKGNEAAFAQSYGYVQMEMSELSMYLTTAEYLETAIEAAEEQAKADENITVKYYSKGDKNLTIKETMKESDDEDAYYGETSVTYDKGLLVESKTKVQSKAGDKMEMNITVKYPKSVKVELPKDWESHIEKGE